MEFDANVKINFGSFGWPLLEDTNNVIEAIQLAPAPASPTRGMSDKMSELSLGSSAPSSRPPLPRYQGRRIDNSDLIDLIDCQGEGLAEILSFMESTQQRLAALKDDDDFTPVQRRRRGTARVGRSDSYLIRSGSPRQCRVHPPRPIRSGQRPGD